MNSPANPLLEKEDPGASEADEVVVGPDLTLIIPAYNEAASIRPVLEEVLPVAREEGWKVLVVDDGSQDGTGSVVESMADGVSLRCIRHATNRGYGAALKTGLLHAATDWVAMMDADGQHRVEDLRGLLRVIAQNDMLVGQRVALIHSPLWRMPGKWVLQGLATHFSGRRIPDLNSGMRVVRRDVVRRYVHLCPNGFSFSTTLTLVLLNRGYVVSYHPIETRPRQGKSNVSMRTGFETLLLILRLTMLLDPLRIFLPVSLALVVTGLLWAIPFVALGRGLSVGAMLLITNGTLIFFVGLLSDQVAILRKERYE